MATWSSCRKRTCLLWCILFSLTGGPALGANARFLPLNFSGIAALSADGQVVAGRIGNASVLWTEARGVERFPVPPGLSLRYVNDLSGDGTTIVGGVQVGSGLTGHYEPFRWTREGGYQLLGSLSTDWLDDAYATATSYNGDVIVGTNRTPEGRRAFRWTPATGLVNLGTLGTTNPYYDPFSEAEAVTDDGSITVGTVSTDEDAYYKPFLWTESGGFNLIGLPAAPHPGPGGIPAGGASRVSGDGKVVTGASQVVGDLKYFSWTAEGGFVPLQAGADINTAIANSISRDGSTIVGTEILWNVPAPGKTTTHASIWRLAKDGYQFARVADVLAASGVDISGWQLTNVYGVSADGRTLLGIGVDPQGINRAWYAVLSVPEPAAGAIAAIAVSMTGCVANMRPSRRLRRPQG
ncbi:hypothetical protein [Lacipirellula limnantheis]|nr:hypothetical protein [Lacipirellula limnantheis]